MKDLHLSLMSATLTQPPRLWKSTPYDAVTPAASDRGGYKEVVIVGRTQAIDLERPRHGARSNDDGRRVGVGTACGTCGELLQGVIGNHDFLITFPADLTVHAHATEQELPGVQVWPPHKVKARCAAQAVWRRLGGDEAPAQRGLRITLHSAIPESKGLASSSADIVATCRAVAALHGAQLSEPELCELACQIEPSDAVMYEHPVAFDFLQGIVLEDPARPFGALAMVVDTAERVDTLGFRRVPYTAEERRAIEAAYGQAIAGLRDGDLDKVGAAATTSARLNQRRHHKPHLEELIRIAARRGSYGVSIAHSGTVAALLFDERDSGAAIQAGGEVAQRFAEASISYLYGRSAEQPAMIMAHKDSRDAA